MKRMLTGVAALAAILATFAIGVPAAFASETLVTTVTHNGVTCGEWKTNLGSPHNPYPAYYWDCINPTAPTQAEQNMYTGVSNANLPSRVVNVMNNNNEQLYLFNSPANFASFTGDSAPQSNAFGTVNGTYIATFASASVNGTQTSLTSYYAADMIQQIGAAYGQLTPNGDGVNSTAFQVAISTNYDVEYLDYIESVQNVWSSYYSSYPNQNSWYILNAVFGVSQSGGRNVVTTSQLYGYAFQAGSNQSTLNTLDYVIKHYMPTMMGYVQDNVWASTPTHAIKTAANTNPPGTTPNGVLCAEWTTGYTSPFNQPYWDCHYPYSPTATTTLNGTSDKTVAATAASLSTTFQTALDPSNWDVTLYIFHDASEYNNLFGTSIPLNVLGTSVILTSGATHTSALFAMYSNGIQLVDASKYYQATTVHELAHQLDSYWGGGVEANFPSQTNTNYLTAYCKDAAPVKADASCSNSLPESYLNSTACTTVFSNNQSLCTQYPSDYNWQRFESAYGYTDSQMHDEIWAYAMQKASGYTTTPLPQGFEGYLSNINGYMSGVWSSGHP